MTVNGDKSDQALQASLMDSIYRYQRHIYDVTRKYYLLGRDRTIRDLHVPPGGSLLEIGCGTGRNLLVAHRHFPDAAIYGLDLSTEMLETCRKSIAASGLDAALIAADATTFKPTDFGISGFDRILISYSVSMIPAWPQAIDAALSALNSNGQLHIVDFGQQEQLPRWFRRTLHAWLKLFHVQPRAELQRVLTQYAAQKNAIIEFQPILRGYAYKAKIILKK